MEKKKVKYGITRFTRKGSYRLTGIGEIDDENLYIKFTDKDGNEVIKTLQCLDDLHPVNDAKTELKGSYFEYETVQFENDKGQTIELEIEADYNIWLKII